MDLREEAKVAFKAFFDEQFANVEWVGWETDGQPGRVLVDAVFDLDALLDRILSLPRIDTSPLDLCILAALGGLRDDMPPEDVAAVQRFVDKLRH